MERREGRQLVQLSKPKPAFERHIGAPSESKASERFPSSKAAPAKTFTWNHFCFMFSFVLIDSATLPRSQAEAFCGTFRGRFP